MSYCKRVYTTFSGYVTYYDTQLCAWNALYKCGTEWKLLDSAA